MNQHLLFCLWSNGEKQEEIAQGAVFSNGKVALATTDDHAITIFDDMGAAVKRHCRNGAAHIIWDYTAINFNLHNLPTLAELLA